MPLRMRAPYLGRIYMPRSSSGGGGRGIDIAGPLSKLAKAFQTQGEQQRANQIANQLMNTATPPRAGAVGPVVNPATGQITSNITPTVGTSPITGGLPEMRIRSEFAKSGLADQLQQARIATELMRAKAIGARGGGGGGGGAGGGGAGAGNAARWKAYLGGDTGAPGGGGGGGARKSGKPAAYEPGSIDPLTDPEADKFGHVQADFDSQYGKNAYSKIAPYLPNATVDDKGNYIINAPTDPNEPDSKPKPLMTLSADQANYWLARYNAARVRSGQQPIFADKFPSANPNSGQPAGTQVNPYKPSNQLEARSLPYNTFFVDPDTGQVGQKLPEAKESAPEKKTSQVDTGDQEDQLASGETSQPEERLAETSEPAEQPPDMATGVGSDETGGATPDVGSSALADAIARARAQDQLLARNV